MPRTLVHKEQFKGGCKETARKLQGNCKEHQREDNRRKRADIGLGSRKGGLRLGKGEVAEVGTVGKLAVEHR